MVLTGSHFLGRTPSRAGSAAFRAGDPISGRELDPTFCEATPFEIDRAARLAESASEQLAARSGRQRAAFLRGIGERIAALGDELLERCHAETALPMARLESERGRTLAQLRMFAALLDEGSWVGARIDRGDRGRQPVPRPDLRRMQIALGPVAVFGASNFPLAFSVAGGDTASAFAAGCPVVVKAHPGHPGTSELVATAILQAAADADLPDGVFSLLHGTTPATGQALASHAAIQAVGFTGSLRGGRALYDAAARRPHPIPVYAEMGSSNPVFALPEAVATRGDELARQLAASVLLGAGQFCTNPGLVALGDGPAERDFLGVLALLLAEAPIGTMAGFMIKSGYERALSAATAVPGVRVAARSMGREASAATEARAALLVVDAKTFRHQPRLHEEIFGPATLAVRCGDRAELEGLARALHGQLTATVHGTDHDLDQHAELLAILRGKVGRLIVNGMPTGVEVSAAMQHGGPYPATTDSRSTSVGSAAIERFVRPVCFQDVPDRLLPAELRDANPLGIWRLVDGQPTREPL